VIPHRFASTSAYRSILFTNSREKELQWSELKKVVLLAKGSGETKIKIVRANRQSNLLGSCQSIFSLCWHHFYFLLSSVNFPKWLASGKKIKFDP